MRRPDVPIVGDCRLVIEELIKAIRDLQAGGADAGRHRRVEEPDLAAGASSSRCTYEPSEPGEALKPQFCLEQLRDIAPEGTILVVGVGQHQMWASQYWRSTSPYTWVNSGGLGTMGFCGAGRHRRQGRPPRPHGVGRRRRRLLPDDGAGAGDRVDRAHPDQGRAS